MRQAPGGVAGVSRSSSCSACSSEASVRCTPTSAVMVSRMAARTGSLRAGPGRHARDHDRRRRQLQRTEASLLHAESELERLTQARPGAWRTHNQLLVARLITQAARRQRGAAGATAERSYPPAALSGRRHDRVPSRVQGEPTSGTGQTATKNAVWVRPVPLVVSPAPAHRRAGEGDLDELAVPPGDRAAGRDARGDRGQAGRSGRWPSAGTPRC